MIALKEARKGTVWATAAGEVWKALPNQLTTATMNYLSIGDDSIEYRGDFD